MSAPRVKARSKREAPIEAESGSALVLVLLITALLTTIAVSFLSTARVEMIAAKNFTRQNAASGLAEMATQQAMGKIASGFNSTTTGTTILTTQPGVIRQFQFSAGNCSLVAEEELFSGTGTAATNGTANLNNLQNPTSSASATSNQWTITGNASEQINVPMEVVEDSAGNPIGRIAFYVDDEGTKLNVNCASGNRSTLNAGLRPQDIRALSTAAESDFSNLIGGGLSNNSSDISNWSHFFRPEQVSAAVSGITENHTPFISTATSSANSAANMTHLLTPWGTEKIDINTLSTNATNGSGDASVATIHSALTTANLTAIYGSNFSTKYTSLGVKQIAANMLQMRELGKLAATMNKTMVEASFDYTGPLIGSLNRNILSNGQDGEIPAEYLGHAPYPVISEIGMSACLASAMGGGTSYTYVNSANQTVTVPVSQADWGFKLQPMVELYNPYPVPFTIPAGAFPRVMIRPSRLTCNMSWSGPNGNFSGNFAFGSNSSKPSSWTYSWWFGIRTLTNVNLDQLGRYDLVFQANGNSTTIPPYSKIQTRLYLHGAVWEAGYTFLPLKPWSAYPHNGGNITIHSISDVKIQFDRIILLANSGNNVGNAALGYTNTIRDWVRGDEIGELDVEFDSSKLPYEFKWNGSQLTLDPDFNPPSNANGKAAPVPTKSAQRISHFTRIPRPNSPTAGITINDSNRNWTTANATTSALWFDDQVSWVTPSSNNFGHLGSSNSTSTDALLGAPSASAGFTIPSDPSLGDSASTAVYASDSASDMREPFLLTGNYSCPADLGLVPTNQRWRRLRMQMQPSDEGSLIPDWAMLDVISFGNSTDSSLPYNRFQPVNINGNFHLPSIPENAPIAPRTVALDALAKILEVSSTGNIQDPMDPSILESTDAIRFKGNSANATAIANAIGNMTWSANSTWGQGNSTNDPGSRRQSRNFPVDQYILPSEIMEIAGVADAVSQTDYNNSTSHFKWNEGRASALIPAVTTRSSFFTIYAYAQALDNQGNIDSESLTKTLLEVLADTSTSPTIYKVKKLYTQPIPMGE